MIYFGFAIADNMFPSRCTAERRPATLKEVKAMLEGPYVCACNPSHDATIEVARKRYGLNVFVPTKAARVNLLPGDRFFVMSVRGLPRLEGRHEYSEEEVAGASFEFARWAVI